MKTLLPSLIIPGAPKCGTTAIYEFLRLHPAIFFPELKEPNFFADDIWSENIGYERYKKLYSAVPDAVKLAGDASTGYLLSEKAIPGIEQTLDDCRYVVCLRNPVDLAYSYHSELRYRGVENIADFERAWYAQRARRRGEMGVPIQCPSVKLLLYAEVASLGTQLKRMMEYVDPARIQVVFLEDLVVHPRAEYLRILNFLGVEDDGRTAFPRVNTSSARRWPLFHRIVRLMVNIKNRLGIGYLGDKVNRVYDALNNRPVRKPELEAWFRAELEEQFRGEVELLEELTGRDLKTLFRFASSG